MQDVIRPDLITCWPRSHDYPLWRQQIARDIEKFTKVIVVFTSNTHGHDLRNFVRSTLPRVHFVESEDAEWYDHALRAGLAASTAEWVWFTEEDFFYTEFFLDGLLTEASAYDMVAVDDGRTDPSCCLIRRSALDQNYVSFQSRDGFDNFDIFSAKVKANVRWTTPESLGLDGYHHMRGLSHNHYLARYGSPVEYQPDEFAAYLRGCLEADVTLDPAWRQEVEAYLLRFP